MKRRLAPGMLALVAATAAGASMAPTPAPMSAPTSPTATAQTPGERQAPAPAPTTAPAELAFLANLGAPLKRRGRPSGIPWPGRKVACMLRRAGRVKRMRH